MQLRPRLRPVRSSAVQPPLARRTIRRPIGEITSDWTSGLRRSYREFRRTFWPAAPMYAGTKISYEKARSLYRNDDRKANLGSGLCRRIINSVMDFIDLPYSDTGDELYDEFLNDCIHVYWRHSLLEMIRNATREADCVVRFRRDDPENKLVSTSEWEAGYLEILPPERVAIFYKEGSREIERAYIRHVVEVVEDDQWRMARRNGNGTRAFSMPYTREHVIIEEITPESYRYYDETTGEWLNDREEVNSWGFVALLEVHNEYDTTLEGGQSDLEAPLPFIMALHDVMAQTLTAHKAHSIPKAKFKVGDLLTFLANNWPDAFDKDEEGNPIPGTFSGEITWKGTEILFMEADEDAEFMQAESVLGDSITLMGWLVECISISSETPKSILMNARKEDHENMTPFSKKINRKRSTFTPYIQTLCKMVLAVNFMEPLRVPLVWDEISADEALKRAQALQQEVMSSEVLATRQVVSDQTVRKHIRPFMRGMKSNEEEARDARTNVQPMITSSGSASPNERDSGRNE